VGDAQTRRVIAAGMIGNVLEWYDFAIYGYFAASIGRHFFPQFAGGSSAPAVA
jgi:MHS family proline/betaine transporter-like MFS transporter